MKGCTVIGCNRVHYGKGLCQRHYGRLRKTGSINAKKVVDLPGEVWSASEKPVLRSIYFSNMGRVKSRRKLDERLLKSSLVKQNGHLTGVLMVSPGGCQIRIAPEILRIFHGNAEGDTNVVYHDGDPANCKVDNLAWYGKNYLVEKAIVMAEKSDHPLADCFLKFWHGDHAAINDWLISITDPVRGYIFTCLRRVGFPWHLEVEDLVQQSLFDIFIALYRGMIKSFDNLHQWVLSVAKAVYLRFMRTDKPIFLEYSLSDGDTGNVADLTGFCQPSAELQAIYNELKESTL